MTQSPRDRAWAMVALSLAVLINLVAIDQPLMGDDATLYAAIAAGMVRRGDYLGLYAWGQDWLDKPHLPFWLTAAAFRAFGITPWAYRLPGFLAIVAAAWYTFGLAARFHGRSVGVWAAAILLTAQHTILSSADVRAEPYVALFVTASIWYLVRVAEDDQWIGAAVGCGLATAAALMSKGPFTIIPMAGALGGHWFLHGRPPIRWRRWLTVALVAAVGITPELWALYAQFDSHPEKLVLGRTGVSGIRFFFWDSQFGRFLGTGPIRRQNGSPIYFVHTLLWAFLPWSCALILALVRRVRVLRAGEGRSVEWYCAAGAVAMFLVFSLSKFQLPYYLNIIFPLLAVLTAAEFADRTSPTQIRTVSRAQIAVVVTMVIFAGVLGILVRPAGASDVTGVAILLLFIMPVVRYAVDDLRTWILTVSILGATSVNLYLERALFPTLNTYDGGLAAAAWVNQHRPQATVVVPRDGQVTSFAFGLVREPVYVQQPADTSVVAVRPYLMLVKSDRQQAPDPRTIQSFDHFQVSAPTLRFINHQTRPAAMRRVDLLLIGGEVAR